MFIWGVILFCTGIATIYGDQLWFQFPSQIYPAERVVRGRIGKLLSHILCGSGVILIIAALINNWT